MRILVHAAGEKPIRIVIPTRVLCNRLTAALCSSLTQKYAAKRHAFSLPPHAVHRLMRELNRAKRMHPGLELVSVDSSEGDHIRIVL